MNEKILLKFGDYVLIEMKRHGVSNEKYLHKVINTLRSNSYVMVPVQSPAKEVLTENVEDVVSCICCGVDETVVLKYKISDVKKVDNPRK